MSSSRTHFRRIDLQTDYGSANGVDSGLDAGLDTAATAAAAAEHDLEAADNCGGSGTTNTSGAASKRPVSMFEPRDSPYNTHQPKQSTHQPHQRHGSVKVSASASIPESRTTSSMYQMAAPAQTHQLLPAGDEVRVRTDTVTRRIQELWTVVQDHGHRDAYVPCAERIRAAIEELTAIFPTVRMC